MDINGLHMYQWLDSESKGTDILCQNPPRHKITYSLGTNMLTSYLESKWVLGTQNVCVSYV
jgi:hypothetical protein